MSGRELPNEILLEIFYMASSNPKGPDYLKTESRHTLLDLCLSCKRFRDLAQPLLCREFDYREFEQPLLYRRPGLGELGQISSGMVVYAGNERQMPAIIRCYLRTMIERPDLAACCSIVMLKGWTKGTGTETNLRRPDPPSEAMGRMFSKAAASFDLSIANTSWRTALSNGREDAEVALLLTLTPNIKKLVIEYPAPLIATGDDFVLNSLLAKAVNPGPEGGVEIFKNLRVLTIYSEWPSWSSRVKAEKSTFPLQYLLACLSLPSLRFLYVYAYLTSLTQSGPVLPMGSKLEELCLDRSIITKEGLDRLMQSFTHLRTLTISKILPSPGGTTSPMGNDVCKALLHQRRSLQVLGLHDTYEYGNRWQWRIESLVQFGSLAYLTIDAYLPMGHDLNLPLAAGFNAKNVLPKHLKALHVVDTFPTALVYSLESLVEHVAWFDSLECITFHYDQVESLIDIDNIDDIVEYKQRMDRAKEQLLEHGIKEVGVADFPEQDLEEDGTNMGDSDVEDLEEEDTELGGFDVEDLEEEDDFDTE